MKRSLNQYAMWPVVLPRLGVEAMGMGPPMSGGPCPLCGAQWLHIYRDDAFGGCWCFCPWCRWSGDLIELAGQVWELNIRATIHELRRVRAWYREELVTPQAIQLYVEQHLARRQRCRALTDKAGRDFVPRTPEILNLVCKVGLRRASNSTVKGMGRFIVPTDTVEINRVVRPHVDSLAAATTGSRVLPGRDWRDLLCVPFSHLPGQLSGFLLIGRQGDPWDIVFHSLTASQSITRNGRPHPPIEAGVAMGELLFAPTARPEFFGNTFFVFVDPLAALRLQAKYLRDHQTPLPIVGGYSGRLFRNRHGNVRPVATMDVSSIHPDWDYVFFAENFCPEVFEMACRPGGKVCIGLPQAKCDRLLPHLQLLHIKRRAKPWWQALEEAVRTLPQERLIPLLSNLDIPESLLRVCVEQCSATTKQILRQHERFTKLVDTIYVNGRDVLETEGGWFYYGTGRQISNATLRIDRYIRCEGAETFCEGRINLQGNSIPFRERASRIEKRTFSWMRRKLAAAGLDGMEALSGWSRHAAYIATQLHQPSLICIPEKLGWDPRENRFVLPNFMVELGGRVVDFKVPRVDKLVPGTTLPLPTGIDHQALEALTVDTLVNRLFWASAAAITAGVISPVIHRKPVGLGLVGQGAITVGNATAKALGCTEFKAPATVAYPHHQTLATRSSTSTPEWWPRSGRAPAGGSWFMMSRSGTSMA